MITLEDYNNLLAYFEVHAVPDELENFVKKLEVMRDEIVYRKQAEEKIKEYRDKLMELSEKEEKGE
jgi:hypothetical protein